MCLRSNHHVYNTVLGTQGDMAKKILSNCIIKFVVSFNILNIFSRVLKSDGKNFWESQMSHKLE